MKCLLNQNKGDSVFNIWRLSNHLQYNYPTDIKVAFGKCFFYNKFSESHSCILTKENWERQSRLKLLLDAWWTSLRKAHLMLSCFFKAIMQKTTHLWNIISQYLKRTFFPRQIFKTRFLSVHGTWILIPWHRRVIALFQTRNVIFNFTTFPFLYWCFFETPNSNWSYTCVSVMFHKISLLLFIVEKHHTVFFT